MPLHAQLPNPPEGYVIMEAGEAYPEDLTACLYLNFGDRWTSLLPSNPSLDSLRFERVWDPQIRVPFARPGPPLDAYTRTRPPFKIRKATVNPLPLP